MGNFVHLHLHSEYSLLDGSSRCESIVAKAKELGMDAVALTDHGVMYGVVEFYLAAKKAGVKPIIGCEVYVAQRTRFDKTPKVDDNPFHLLLLAKNERGYKNLLKLVTFANLEGFYYKPRVDKELLKKHSEGLIALTSCLAGEVPRLLMEGQKDKAAKAAKEYQEIFGAGNFYLEIQDHNISEQKKINPLMAELVKELDIPVVASNDVHYLERQDSVAHDVLLCIQTGKTLDAPGRLKFETDEFYFKSEDEMNLLFSWIPEAVSNSAKIASECNLTLDLEKTHLPHYITPTGEPLEAFLEKLCREGMEKIFPQAGEELKKRLDYELGVINSKGLAAYFLIVWDFINFAKQRGIPVGPGRGSAAGSIVAYLLGITEIDPIQNGLIFERFLNPERKSLPDIDTDFCWRRRDEVIKYVAEKYGSDRVTQIVTFGRMKARAAIRDVGRALNLPLPLVDKVAKLIPFGKNIRDSLAVPELKELYDKDPKIKQLLELAKSIEGLARNASIHAAGVVISEAPLPEYVPLQRMNGEEIVAQYEMNSLASIGLLKMDFLGLRNLTVMNDCINIIKETRGQEIDIRNLPIDDEKTYQLLKEAKTLGVFQLESPGMRRYIKLLKPNKFDDIVAILALYRPGPLGGGVVEDFIKRKSGKGKVKYLHPSLEPILKETYGVILYQEQVMQIANLAGYSMAKADELRKAMGKKKPEEMAKHREIFENGAVKSGINKKIAEKIFELMEFFAGYGFNKSHSAAYAMVAYQTAYLKANFPKEYMAALMTSIMDSIEKVSFFVQECKDMSINVYPPDINESLVDFKVEKDGIRFGMGAIKNAGRAAIESIIETREEGGKFKDIFDFCSRVDLRLCNKRVMESLIKSGAMDCIGPNRATLLANLDSALENGAQIQREKNSGQISFFDGALDEGLKPATDLPYQEEFSKKQLLSMEKEMIGLYLSSHPLEEVAEELKKCVNLSIENLSELAQGSEIKIGGLVKSLKKIFTRNNQPMVFMQLEDFTGTVEVIVPPKVYEEASSLINEEAILVINGKVDIKERFEKESDEEEPQQEEAKVLAVSIAPLNGSAGHPAANNTFINGAAYRKNNSCFHIKVKVNKCDVLPSLKDIITNYKGDRPVYLHLESCKGRTTIALEKTMWVKDTPEFLKRVESLLGEGAIWTKTEGTV